MLIDSICLAGSLLVGAGDSATAQLACAQMQETASTIVNSCNLTLDMRASYRGRTLTPELEAEILRVSGARVLEKFKVGDIDLPVAETGRVVIVYEATTEQILSVMCR